MGIVSGFVVYIIVWWLVLFTVLPWGIRVPDQTERGFADSAPDRPRLWVKAGITTVIATIIWLAIFYVIESGLITFREP